MVRVGTSGGLWLAQGDSIVAADGLAGQRVTALAGTRERSRALVDGRVLVDGDPARGWRERATIVGPPGTCLAMAPDEVLIGTEEAHLLRLTPDGLQPIESFDTAEGRDAWYTPWGDPADVRSIAIGADGELYVNVHVGGVVRSRDRGRTWTPTIDIEADVHQVLALPARPGLVLAAAAVGCGITRDHGASWEFVTGGLHARYLRAIAVSDDTVLVSASTGPGGRRSALYRRALDGADDFAKCVDGLPTWFDDNIDTGCLAAAGPLVVFGTEDGRLFRSMDRGARWEQVAKGLPPVTCVSVG